MDMKAFLLFILLVVVLCHSVHCTKKIKFVQNETEEDCAIVEVPLQPMYKDSDGKNMLLDKEKPRRHTRHSSTCSIPHELENSNLTCVIYPSKVKCIQTCMFGYTFSEGTQRAMTCDRLWNKWRPVPKFESCEPYVDCGVNLSSGGKIKCIFNFMDRGTVCEISCHHYEDKPAIPAKSYGCNIDGSWTPKLPFCARRGSGLQLVPPPRR